MSVKYARAKKVLKDGKEKIIIDQSKFNTNRVVSNSNTTGKSMTKKEFAADCDINRLVNKYLVTGQNPPQTTGVFNDVSELGDYKESLEFVMKAQEDFTKLNSNVRNEFNNNPQELIEFLEDNKNFPKAVKLGLISKDRLETYSRREAKEKKASDAAKAAKDPGEPGKTA